MSEGPADFVVVGQDHDHRRADIEDAHHRNDFFRHGGDRFDTADNDREDDGGHDQAGDPAVTCQDAIGSTGDIDQLRMRLIGLEHVAATQTAADTKDRKQHRHEAPAGQATLGKSFGHVIHWTA